MKILIVGLTTRALAESAIRAGCDVVTVDYFGDLDQKRLCQNVSLRERGVKFGAAAILETARGFAYDAVVYGGGLENAPDVVAALAKGRTLLGNEPGTLRLARDPAVVLSYLASRGWRVPRVIRLGEPLPRVFWRGKPMPWAGAWVQKPIRGGGGQGVKIWRGQAPAPGQMLQEYVEGVPASAAFVADGRSSVVLGWTEQLRGPRGFLYGGNVLPLEGSPWAADEVRAIADALTAEFGLRGVNGFDFVLCDGRPVVLEVNPRYSASMELIERATGVSVFGLHMKACASALACAGAPLGAAVSRALASPDASAARPGRDGPALGGALGTPTIDGRVWGKAIVYAPKTLSVGDTTAWIARGIRDVPHPGEVIPTGNPICTVFAAEPTHGECRARLQDEIASVWLDCSPPRTPSLSDGRTRGP